MIVAASLCTTEKMAFIIRNGCGIVCAPLTATDARRLNLPPMVAANDAPLGTAFTISVDVKHGHHHRHLGRAALQHGESAGERQHGRERLRPSGPRLPADREGGRRADALGPHRGRGRPLRARQPAPGRGHLRTRQRRRHRHGRAADRRPSPTGTASSAFRSPISSPTGRGARSWSSAWRRSPSRRRSASFRATPTARRFDQVTHFAFVPRVRSATGAACRRGFIAAISSTTFSAAGRSPRCCSASRRRDAGCSSICATGRRACRRISAGAEPDGSDGARARQWREVGLGAQILRDLGVTSIRLRTNHPRTYVGLSGFGIEIASVEPIEG